MQEKYHFLSCVKDVTSSKYHGGKDISGL